MDLECKTVHETSQTKTTCSWISKFTCQNNVLLFGGFITDV